MIHRRYECPALQAEREAYTSLELRQAAASLKPVGGSIVHAVVFCLPLKFCCPGLANTIARCCGAADPKMDCWRGSPSPTGPPMAVEFRC